MKNSRFNSLVVNSFLTFTILLLVASLFYQLGNKNKHINSKYVEKVDRLVAEFPASQASQSSQELDQLIVELGLKPINHNSPITLAKTKEENFNQLRNSLNQFLLEQSQKNNIQSEAIPENLQTYLIENQTLIEQIRQLILDSEKITWYFDITDAYKMSPNNIVIPNYLGTMDLQRIFQLQILADNQQGNQESINQTLEASLKLNQAIQQHPYLISQMVSRMVSHLQDGVIRQIDYLSPQSQALLNQYNYNFAENMTKAFQLEIIMMSSPLLYQDMNSQSTFKPWQVITNKLIQINHQKAIGQMKTALAEIENYNICSLDINEFTEQKVESPWFNHSNDFWFSHEQLVKYWAMAGNAMLDRELTKNIVATKLAYAQTGEYPENLSHPNSETCPQNTWQYQPENQGVTISFSNLKEINAQRQTLDLYPNNSLPSLTFSLISQ